eukprot:TRINITY_DN17579_c0_g1_i1.p1 TRINITY_DN17579_c0_g1~~TRINITY_DN17579_c0_g1_i1.p1  ORF type:complete len:391 (-),score=108.05 TRINITY_DN17579_c0_g1_i1:160-1332(-)
MRSGSARVQGTTTAARYRRWFAVVALVLVLCNISLWYRWSACAAASSELPQPQLLQQARTLTTTAGAGGRGRARAPAEGPADWGHLLPQRFGQYLQYARPAAPPVERTYVPIHCGNSGHFFTEDLPNILLFNVTKVCIWEKCFSSFTDLLALMGANLTFTRDCNTDNIAEFGMRYNAMVPWVSNPGRVYQLLDKEDLRGLYDRVLARCGVDPHAPTSYDVLVFQRTTRRRVVNIELLLDSLRRAGFTYLEMDSGTVANMSQCDIFRAYASARSFLGSYGCDLTYPMILERPIFAFLNKWTVEYFYEVMRSQLGYHNPFRVVQVQPANGEPEGTPGAVSYANWRLDNFYQVDLKLSDINVDETIRLLQVALGRPWTTQLQAANPQPAEDAP